MATTETSQNGIPVCKIQTKQNNNQVNQQTTTHVMQSVTSPQYTTTPRRFETRPGLTELAPSPHVLIQTFTTHDNSSHRLRTPVILVVSDYAFPIARCYRRTSPAATRPFLSKRFNSALSSFKLTNGPQKTCRGRTATSTTLSTTHDALLQRRFFFSFFCGPRTQYDLVRGAC